ncbi:YajQ family cyclic di-GMP-binding protein [Hathewaya histolytica]|uniref:YajQ family cyclic di-GMP-binding protein n=1 Tax=Hathewaya histolytica TaxID=1498 RepID=UPI003B683740
MATTYSFDIVSEVDLQEVDNAINQAVREITNRYDFKGCTANIERTEEEIKVHGEDEYKLNAMKDILDAKLIKRGLSVKALDYGKIENASMGTLRQVAKIVKGISKDKAKFVVSDIKESKLKVQTQIMDNQIRVQGKDKDSLQQVISMLKCNDYGIDLQFINYR